MKFSHLHYYIDYLKTVEEYKRLEDKLNDFAKLVVRSADGLGYDVEAGRAAWLGLKAKHGEPSFAEMDPEKFSPGAQDLVEQSLVGVGWRITGQHSGPGSSSVLVTGPDPDGVHLIYTALNEKRVDGSEPPSKRARGADEEFDHFNPAHVERFSKAHNGRQGCAVLGFVVANGEVATIRQRYTEKHPKLVVPGERYTKSSLKMFEVFAYYKGEKNVSDADEGTILRFIEVSAADASSLQVLPGLKKVDAAHDRTTKPAYHDHWVSNVVSRTGFLDTLNETIGFFPQVEFNAGVVAAGEAQIESTVTGNVSGLKTADKKVALQDPTQIFLPTNNALSEVGHVTLFLREIGQGIQHVASRVENLPEHVQRTNDFRKMTGAGFSFLNIPRSYYGRLLAKTFAKDAGIEVPVAESYIASLCKAEVMDKAGIVNLDATTEQVMAALPAGTPSIVAKHVLMARYSALYALLRDNVSEAEYLRIVRNKILVDIQGDDLLYQIFTCKLMLRDAGHEGHFFEFIQRVCSDKIDPATGKPAKIKPGCGGFGIRNFLTLFLSIEASKAIAQRTEAEQAGNAKGVAMSQRMLEIFTDQLDESNPVLTAISDAMTAEGDAKDRGDKAEETRQAALKAKGNEELRAMSGRYNNMMKELRKANA